MSEFYVEVVQIGDIMPHPNADRLEVTTVLGYPVVVRKGEFRPGDKAVYVPVDAVVPKDDSRWDFLAGCTRIKARKIRGYYSQGLLTFCSDASWEIGCNVQTEMGIVKYEPPLKWVMQSENEKDPGFMPQYTDIEGFLRYENVLEPGERVVLTEKIHGTNARFCWKDDRLWVGSRRNIKRHDSRNLWWIAAEKYELEKKLCQFPGVVFYGEIFGCVQDLRYGAQKGNLFLRFFDTARGSYHDFDDFFGICDQLHLPMVPVIQVGAWNSGLKVLAEGSSLLADHVREGFVVRPIKERYDHRVGRVILKMVGQGYHLRKAKKC